ncbi:MAG: DUF2779 domain-containing protein, partial [Thermoplasmata archaeon]|nr:DUF2779 domain-containing protein [Thermoplasmata archaeon]
MLIMGCKGYKNIGGKSRRLVLRLVEERITTPLITSSSRSTTPIITSSSYTLPMPPSHTLSKSKYIHGLQCLKLLYTEVNDKDSIPPPNLATQLIFEQGRRVGEAARREFPGGVLIPMFPWKTLEERTWDAVDTNVPFIFEGGFIHDDVLVLTDVLRRVDENLFDLIEVKTSSSVKDVHISDIAVQRHVVEGAGLRVNKTYLMHLNKEYVHPEGNELFVLEDVTERVAEQLPDTRANIMGQLEAVRAGQAPEVGIGPHCDKPYECALKGKCWSHIPQLSVFNIPRLRSTKKWELYNEGMIALEQLPPHYGLNHNQKLFVGSYEQGEAIIDREAIRKELASLEEPLYFIDFETMNWALPRYNGTKPHQQVPFQWSLHIQRDGETAHH